ncbi:MAG: hypothetical protein U0V49_04640 [Saprospiraceae bacterium]
MIYSDKIYSQSKPAPKKNSIDISLVDYAEIRAFQKSAKPTKAKRISKALATELIRDWNNSKTTVKCQDSYLYTVSIYFQDYTRRNFNINNNLISEGNSYCISIPDKGLANRLWKGK